MRLSPPTISQLSKIFLRLDGLYPMTGNLKMQGNKILWSYAILKTEPPGGLAVRNVGDSDYANLRCMTFRASDIGTTVTDSILRTASTPGQNNTLSFLQYYLAAWRNVMKLTNSSLEMYQLLNAINGALRLPDTRPGVPQAGDCRYNPATDTFEIYDGAAWHSH